MQGVEGIADFLVIWLLILITRIYFFISARIVVIKMAKVLTFIGHDSKLNIMDGEPKD